MTVVCAVGCSTTVVCAAGCSTIVVCAGGCSTITVCSFVVFRLPCVCALLRSRWMASSTSFCCARNASPNRWVKSSFSFIISSTWGKFTSDLTLGSQVCCSRAVVRASPFRVLFALSHRAASTTSRGYVDAIRICDTSESGYSAMGATNCSISSGLNVVPLLWASRRKGHGHTMSTARSQTKSCLEIFFIGLPFHLTRQPSTLHAGLLIVQRPAGIASSPPMNGAAPADDTCGAELLHGELTLAYHCYPSVP